MQSFMKKTKEELRKWTIDELNEWKEMFEEEDYPTTESLLYYYELLDVIEEKEL